MSASPAAFTGARCRYHAALLEGVLLTGKDGAPSNADSSSRTSRNIAARLVEKLGGAAEGERLAGQMSGNQFEDVTWSFLAETFPMLRHLRPGDWQVLRVTTRGSRTPSLAAYEQYAHLTDFQRALQILTKEDPKLAAAFGGDYTVSPDIVVVRNPEPDDRINASSLLIDESVAARASLRQSAGSLPLLHASISCKWTLRSDRAQNARTEALNLMRNRKGRLPHVVVVTGEPMPTRLASLAMGTGDVDCVYHFALDELRASLRDLQFEDQGELLETMVEGKRLKDIADLPLDLAI